MMKSSSDLFAHLVSLGMLIFLFQVPIFDLDNWGVMLLEMIQSSEYSETLFLITKIVSYMILCFLIGLFLIHNLVIKPNFIETSNYIVFLCSTITINSWQKILFGETRPYMYALLSDKAKLTMVDCETDFGMPSGHLFLTTALYYVVRVRYYETLKKESHNLSNLALNIREGYFLKPDKIYIKAGRTLSYNAYNYLSLFYILLVAICRYVAASHFLQQVVFGFIFGFVWSYIYFRYLSSDLKLIVYNLITKSKQAGNQLTTITLIFIAGTCLSFSLVLCKLYLNNTAETTKLEEYLTEACGPGFHLGLHNFSHSFLSIVSLVMLYSYKLVNIRSYILSPSAYNFGDLGFLRKLLRLFLFCIPIIIMIGLGYFFQYISSHFFTYEEYGIVSLVAFISTCTILAFHYAIVQPLLLYRFKVLLNKEFLFIKTQSLSLDSERSEDMHICNDETDEDTVGDSFLNYSDDAKKDIEMRNK